jgi:hypothetical protein
MKINEEIASLYGLLNSSLLHPTGGKQKNQLHLKAPAAPESNTEHMDRMCVIFTWWPKFSYFLFQTRRPQWFLSLFEQDICKPSQCHDGRFGFITKLDEVLSSVLYS